MTAPKDVPNTLKKSVIVSPGDLSQTSKLLNSIQLDQKMGLRVANWYLHLNPSKPDTWYIWLEKNTSISNDVGIILRNYIKFFFEKDFNSLLSLLKSLDGNPVLKQERLSFFIQKYLPKHFDSHKDIPKIIFLTAAQVFRNPKNSQLVTCGLKLFELEGFSSNNGIYQAISFFENLPVGRRIQAYKTLAESLISINNLLLNKPIVIVIDKFGKKDEKELINFIAQSLNKELRNIDLVAVGREIVSLPIFFEAITDDVILYTQSPCSKLLSFLIIGFQMKVIFIDEPITVNMPKGLTETLTEYTYPKREPTSKPENLLIWGLLKDCPSTISWRHGWHSFFEIFADCIEDETQKISESKNYLSALRDSLSRPLAMGSAAVTRVATCNDEHQQKNEKHFDELIKTEIMDLRAALNQYDYQNYTISKIKTPLQTKPSDINKIIVNHKKNNRLLNKGAKFTKLMASLRIEYPTSQPYIDAVRQFLPTSRNAPKLLFVGPPKSRAMHYARAASTVTNWPLLNLAREGIVGSTGYNRALPEEVSHFSMTPAVIWSHEIPSNFLLATISVQKIPFFVDCGVVWDELIREWLIWDRAPISHGSPKLNKANGLKGLDPWFIFLKGFANYIQYYVAWTRATRELAPYGDIGSFSGSTAKGIKEIDRMLTFLGLNIPIEKIEAAMSHLETLPEHPRHIHHADYGPPIADGIGYTFFSNNCLALAARTYQLFTDVDFKKIDPKNPYFL